MLNRATGYCVHWPFARRTFAGWHRPAAQASRKKDSVVLAMALEPPGLDPTTGAASAIAEVVLYNIFETLTKIKPDGNVSPLLAESWTASPDLKTYTFKLRTRREVSER